ncbi:uncharacterized protein LOC119727860 [Patiria miniata]|uniref:Uncharacterized protein n=1 Tax=Patiria miniata TaxID=46514 RepID=A0A913ZWG6_PATMI|nr:uncharacterized protein LOC119727860 [Patiria miniata]
MDDTPSILTDYYRRMTAWICRHVPSAKSGVSHTKVQVLSSTHCVPPRADFNCPSPSKLCDTLASQIRSHRRPGKHPENENRAQDAKLVCSGQDHRASKTVIGDGATTEDAFQSDHSGHLARTHSSTSKVNEIAGNFSGHTRDNHGTVEGEDPPTGCLCLPVLSLQRWRNRRRAKVAPFNPRSPSIKPATTSPSSCEDTRVQPLTTEVSVFDLEDENGQESPGLGLPTRQMMQEDMDEWRQRRRSEILLGNEEDDMKGISRESLSLPSRPKTSKGREGESDRNDQRSERGARSSTEVNTETNEFGAGKQAGKLEFVGSGKSRHSDECDSDEVLYYWKNLDVKDNDEDEDGNRSCVALAQSDEVTTDGDTKWENSLSRMSSLKEVPPRPKTSRGLRPENGQEDRSSVMERSLEEVISTLFREEDGVRDFTRDDVVLDKTHESDSGIQKSRSPLEETHDSCEVLSVWRNPDEMEHKDEEIGHDVSPSKDGECDRGEKTKESSPPGHDEVSHLTCENQKELISPKSSEHSMDADGVMMTREEELQFERQQREQWQLAALGEWATVCQDYDEDEYLSECYLRMDEFQKEQAMMKEWKAISERYHSVGVIQDLQNMQTLCKCTINQSERALRQFARICRGPVPLSKSGQTKAEAIAPLSRMVQKQTRRISENISTTFMEFYQIFEELDVLRERQDRVEEFLLNDLKIRDAEVALSQSSSRCSTITPRQVSSRLQQREIDQDLVDRYMEKYRVRSTDLFEVMPTICENEVFHLEECQELDESEVDFPEYSGMDDVCLDENDVRENDAAEDESSDSNFVKSAGEKEERNVDGAVTEG